EAQLQQDQGGGRDAPPPPSPRPGPRLRQGRSLVRARRRRSSSYTPSDDLTADRASALGYRPPAVIMVPFHSHAPDPWWPSSEIESRESSVRAEQSRGLQSRFGLYCPKMGAAFILIHKVSPPHGTSNPEAEGPRRQGSRSGRRTLDDCEVNEVKE
ncbi:hypothetical protein THAOC_00982, partial [Thalassiosira oceanica]